MQSRSVIAVATLAVAASSLPTIPIHAEEHSHDDPLLSTLSWRNIGPSRGGRASSATGVIGDPLTYYFGATGGGVWKTTDAGQSWNNVTDGFVETGSVGAVTVAPSDDNVVYIGMGETCVRGNFSHGDGMYKSTNAGKTWEHIGLDDTHQIGRIIVHPDDPDTLWVAALGHVFGENAQRGVFMSTDGGDTFERVLHVSDKAGAVDLAIDPFNPRVLFASIWEVNRTPWSLSSGGEDSGLYRSVDGGLTWEECTEGLPDGIKGKIGVDVSGAQRDLVYAIVEAEDGGVFKSTDGGDSWSKVNSDNNLRQRAWYYTHIHADPQDPDTVYVMNVQFLKSTDGGRNFSSIRVPHGDNHDLWIDPNDNTRMINANDGGANVSFNGGSSWSRQDNQPTSQFYHVTTDNNFPYRVLGAQQDNSTVSISSEQRLGWRERHHAVGGGESGYIAPRPDNPDIIYAGSYHGFLTRYDHRLGLTRTINVWPENVMGAGVEAMDYRFQWTFPIIVSEHDNDILYVAGNHVFRSTNEGESWDIISPDLTTNDPTKQRSSGGPITKDNTSVEYYCTIFALTESPFDSKILWAGSDDGLVHVTRDGGDTWTNVTPTDMGDWPLISIIEHSRHDENTVYLAVNRYKMDDHSPYIYVTRDGGESWDLIVDGINDDAFVRVVREDPERPGLLYAGTETGVYYSRNGGKQWHSLQDNLPIVPITDLVVRDNDVVVATQGRSFWTLEDIVSLRELDDDVMDEAVAMLAPSDTYREPWDAVRLHYWLEETPEESVEIRFYDKSGDLIREFSSENERDNVSTDAGMNLFTWNHRYEGAVRVPGAVGWPSTPRGGPAAIPGLYTACLIVGDTEIDLPLDVLPNPHLETTAEEWSKQLELLLDIRDLLDETNEAIIAIRDARKQINAVMASARKVDKLDDIKDDAQAILDALNEIEEALIQSKNKSSQDALNYPAKLDEQLAALFYYVEGDYGPTKQAYDVFQKVSSGVNRSLDMLDELIEKTIPDFNELVDDADIPAVIFEDNDDEERDSH
ncbi:MAG: WD40/YVTN/BNR-like repeat-containing protein [Planctomycetota bacterium]|jgi:photosystem II stability/assembly factor-like uncharacterized protein